MSVPIADRRRQISYGIQDVLCAEAKALRQLENQLALQFAAADCEEIRPPTLELAETIAPVVRDETTIYKLIDRSGDVVALRPDLTASVARLVATHFPVNERSRRLWYAGQVFRYDRSSGRPQELRQAGVEWFAAKGADTDAALVTLAANVLQTAVSQQFQIALGHAAVLEGLWDGSRLSDAQRAALRQSLVQRDHVAYEGLVQELHLPAAVQSLWLELVLAPPQDLADLQKKLAAIGQCPQAVAGVARLQEIEASIAAEQPDLIPFISFDFGLIRDFTYYTGLIMEGFAAGVPQPVLTGGRYDDLLAAYGAPQPALGFALDLSALVAASTATGGELI